MEEPKPKKRGRKRGSKNKTNKIKNELDNDLLNIDNNISQDNGIIQLKNNIDIKDTIEIDGFDQVEEFKILKETSCKVCWNCCHNFYKGIYGLPLKYGNNIFYIYGYFCSFECMYRYVYENMDDQLNDINQLINLYHYNIYKSYSKCNIAPNKLSLNLFGGPISIEEYRETFDNITNEYVISMPLIIPINHTIINNNNNKLIKKENLKLYRTKEIKDKGENINTYINQ